MEKVTSFKNIPQYISIVGAYNIDVSFHRLVNFLEELDEDYGLELNPDFQRGRVWSDEQRIKYLEYFLRGGMGGNILYFNSPRFNDNIGEDIDTDKVLCIDGLQRITAVKEFMEDKIPVFGSYFSEFEDKPREVAYRFKVYVNGLTKKKDILKWYIELNEGGTPHSKEELDRVKNMLEML